MAGQLYTQVVDCSKPVDHPEHSRRVPMNATQQKRHLRDRAAVAKARAQRAIAYLRIERNRLLAESDWTELASAQERLGAKKAKEWAEYRQTLRDLPANTADPENPDWPIPPKG